MNIGVYPVISFFITVIILPILIPYLHRVKFGQIQREEGLESHKVKTGTPTIGGISFLIATIITLLLMAIFDNSAQTNFYFLCIFVTFCFGLIGFMDDFLIVVKKNNEGLTPKQKLSLQLAVALLFIILYSLMTQFTFATAALVIPFTTLKIPLSYAYIIFVMFWLVGFSNAVNLTDGLDGLATGLAIFSFSAFAFIAYQQQQVELMSFCLILVGSLVGFLIFNKYPAKIFMGDTGSLALGGILATVSIMLHQELLLLLTGIVFVAETASVMIQVSYFKKTGGKRIFRMTPLHHHYEKGGWKETKVVAVFWIVGLLAAILSTFAV